MRESRTFGSVGGEGGNVLAYPAISCRQWGRRTTAEDDPKLPSQSLNLWNGAPPCVPRGYRSKSPRGRLRAEGSSLRRPRLAQSVKTVLDVLGVLVGENTFVDFNRRAATSPSGQLAVSGHPSTRWCQQPASENHGAGDSTRRQGCRYGANPCRAGEGAIRWTIMRTQKRSPRE